MIAEARLPPKTGRFPSDGDNWFCTKICAAVPTRQLVLFFQRHTKRRITQSGFFPSQTQFLSKEKINGTSEFYAKNPVPCRNPTQKVCFCPSKPYYSDSFLWKATKTHFHDFDNGFPVEFMRQIRYNNGNREFLRHFHGGVQNSCVFGIVDSVGVPCLQLCRANNICI